MARDTNESREEEWWLDRWIWRIVSPFLKLVPKGSEKKPRPKRTRQEIYGSSELCYCGSEKKYKHCCKKINKREGKIAYKVITTTRKGTKVKIKVKNQADVPRLFESPMYDSGINPSDMIDID